MNIDIDLHNQLLLSLKRLSLLYRELTEHADALLEDPELSIEAVTQLLDHRDLAISEVKSVESELLNIIASKYPELHLKDIPSVLKLLKDAPMPDLEIIASFQTALKALVETDVVFQKRLLDMKTEVAEEIKRTRKSTNLVKGYKQNSPTGSAFIDKLK